MSFQKLSVPNVAQALAGAGSIGDAGDALSFVQISALTFAPGAPYVINLHLRALAGRNTGIAVCLPGETASTFIGTPDEVGDLLFEGNYGANNAVAPAVACTISFPPPTPTPGVGPVVFTLETEPSTITGPIGGPAVGIGIVASFSCAYVPASQIVQPVILPPPPVGIMSMIAAIQAGTLLNARLDPIADKAQLSITTPWGVLEVSNFFYANLATANQLAQLLGGTVVQLPPFGKVGYCYQPLAYFIQLPTGQTVNAACLAYYAQNSGLSAGQLAADITQTINQGSAVTAFYQNGAPLPYFPVGYIGPPIAGWVYPLGSVGSDGNVVNPGVIQ